MASHEAPGSRLLFALLRNAADKWVAGPTGMLIYHPGGQPPMMARQLGTELVSNILAALIAAFVVSMTTAPFGRRVLLVGLIGLFAWLSFSVSYWTWYRFPTAWAFAEFIDQVGGWLLGGAVIAAVFRRK